MKTIRFIFSYILDAFRSSLFTSLLVVLCAVVSGYVTTTVYGIMKGEVGDVSRMFVPTYMLTYTADGEQTLQGTQDLASLLGIMDRYDAKFGRESDANTEKHQSVHVQYHGGSDPMFGNSLILSWDREVLGAEAIDKGQAVAVVPQVLAEGYGWQVGDTVQGFGLSWQIVGISEDIQSLYVPYTCVIPEVEIRQFSLSFVPDRKLSDADLTILQTTLPEADTLVKDPGYKMPYAFLFATAVCALNILVSAIYIVKRAAHKYSVSKILGASNALVAGAMLCELGFFTLLGTVVGHLIAAVSLHGFGILAERHITLTFWDTLVLLAVNLVVTLVICAYSIIKRACPVPCKQ